VSDDVLPLTGPRTAPHCAAGSPASAASGDLALLARARAGDRAAFGALVERHHALVTALVRQRGGARAPVEDLVQETFARALANLGGFRGGSSFVTWTASIALHLATDWRRKEQRRARLAPRSEVEADEVASAGAPGAGDAAELREEAERARAALDALPRAQRVAVTLRVVEDLTYDEVAARLAAPVPRVRTWVSRGLSRLRREMGLAEEGGHDV
jgi:RNA polymerase sigma-70 factor (ECF subfamily)